MKNSLPINSDRPHLLPNIDNRQQNGSQEFPRTSNTLFKDKAEEKQFFSKNFELLHELSTLRTAVDSSRAQKINIPLGVHIPSIANLLGTLEQSRGGSEILVNLGLLTEKQLGKAQLKSAHIKHLLSNGVILHLVSGAKIDLQALSHVPEDCVTSGILEVMNFAEDLDNSKEIIANMVNSGLFVNICSGIHFRTPLHEATSWGYSDIVTMLLENGAEVSLNVKDRNHQTPLEIAETEGHKEIVSILRKNTKKLTHNLFSMKTA